MSPRVWSMLCHLSALSAFAIPFGHLIGPLIVWSAGRDRADEIDRNGREAINFQLTMTLLSLVVLALVAICVLVLMYFGFALTLARPETILTELGKSMIPVALFFIALALFVFIWVYDLVMTVVNAIRAGDGKPAAYGVSIRFLK